MVLDDTLVKVYLTARIFLTEALMPMEARPPLHCSFCRKSEKEVEKLISGPAVFICGACVRACVAILDADAATPPPAALSAPFEGMADDKLLALLRPGLATLDDMRDQLHAHVSVLRTRGVSWEKIGKAMGVSRQAAWERFG